MAGHTTAEQDRLFGHDIWFDLTNQGADYIVTPAGDWKAVTGREALRQAVIRRLLTNPGEWPTLPEYGAGVRLFVKARNTQAARDEMADRISANLLRDRRILSVDRIVTELLPDSNGLKIAVTVTPRGATLGANPLIATVEIS